MKEKSSESKKFGKWFYVIMLAITVAILALLGVWAWTKNNLYLYLLLGLCPIYVLHIVLSIVLTGRYADRAQAARSELLAVALDPTAEIVYLTYLGGERRVKRPSRRKKDYLAEFYTRGADVELLKRHLWFDLSEREEEELLRHRLGQLEIAYPLLSEIKGKKVLVQSAFYDTAKDLPQFSALFGENQIILYGE